ncbi:Wzy polymerase domain-containing protein [Paucibacter sp. DJ1R-11]|uniref:PglL family O-oligosaccharyltransferase n=1 Tax=Paucibacter sp. DJ1R-11 TaxID=2893556 RepID=UPI0021E3FDB1|nr:O-antigen ligase family protein [Paucibacter sp. DJ1R-11]MCV2362481.1 Wzy polymerase domain-containing protein [Paucibacter sp. DJ1R-11]
MSSAHSTPQAAALAAPIGPLCVIALLLANAVPPLVAFSLTPSATLFNQLAALGAWGLVLLALRSELGAGALQRQHGPAVWALLLLLAAPWQAWAWAGLPLSLALANSGMIAAALALLWVGQGFRERQRAVWFEALCWGLLMAGLLSLLVSVVQVFAPSLADGTLIARSGVPGRAVGNMRQPNHLASLLMWASVAAVFLGNQRRFAFAGGRLALPLLLFGFVFAVVLTASRTGMIGVLILALWGILDRKLERDARLSLLATPLMLVLSWWLMSIWASHGAHAFGAESRLSEGAGSPSRIAILLNAWELLKLNPLSGVGWGEFNLAWSMSEFPKRPVAFFDHTHNIAMQLAVELGLPLAGLILALLGWSLWQALRLSRAASGEDGVARRCAFMLVLMIGLHSLLEYPLWYAYFLLPTAFMLGLALGRAPAPATTQSTTPDGAGPGKALPAVGLVGALLLGGSLLAGWDYLRVVAIYLPGADARPLSTRIEEGRRSIFFATQADYAAATSGPPGAAALAATRSTAHNLIDVRLMMAWAKSLHAVGDDERARHVVQRLREFHYAVSEEWLAECQQAGLSEAEQPFQCQAPSRVVDWREMR